MSGTHRIISAVDRVIEPPDVWTRRLSKSKFAERIPRLERHDDGADVWIIDGRVTPLADIAHIGALMSDRANVPTRWDEIPQASYDPAVRLKAMTDDGVDCAVLYPSLAGFSGERFGVIADPELELACAQAYNDWLIDEWLARSSALSHSVSCHCRRSPPQWRKSVAPSRAATAA